MLYAKKDNDRIKATPKDTANCPYCESKVIAKCGNINIWHWAHKVKSDSCLYKDMSQWHMQHQLMAENEGWKIEQHTGYRIADCIKGINVIELQKSSISDQEILNRNINYDAFRYNVHWVFDYTEKINNMRFTKVDNIYKFKQNWAKKSIIILFNYIDNNHKAIWGNVFFNIGDDEYIKVEKLYDSGNGYGKLMNFDSVLRLCNNYRKRR